ncbi:MAG: DUF2452 domain-containing protein [Desulfurivibrionaceae bacterium]
MGDNSSGKYKGERHHGPAHNSPYPVSRLAPPIDLVDMAKEIEQADNMVNTRVSSKLQVIADQIRGLQEEARQVLEEGSRDQDLHRVPCHFKRVPGHIYHLYQKEDGSRYFSMLSPEDWNNSPPHTFRGSYMLGADQSWTPVEELGKEDDSRQLVRRLLGEE